MNEEAKRETLSYLDVWTERQGHERNRVNVLPQV